MIHPGPGFSVADVHRGWYRALVGLGCQVVDVNYDSRLSFYASAGRMSVDGEFVRLKRHVLHLLRRPDGSTPLARLSPLGVEPR